MARSEAVGMLRRGIEHWNRYVRSTPSVTLRDLSELDLTDSSFPYIKQDNSPYVGRLFHADFDSTDLTGSILANLFFVDGNFSMARLRAVDCRNSWFSDTRFSFAWLDGGNFEESEFRGVEFRRTKFDGANFTGVLFADVNFVDVDLCAVLESADVRIAGAGCTVDWRTVLRSLAHPRLPEFLVESGTPEVFATYIIDCARSISESDLFSLLRSTFISYGGPDEPFAVDLQRALRENGVSTFLFITDAIPGDRIHQIMRTEMQRRDRVVVICSEHSLNRPGVLYEIEETLAREAREGGSSLLIPISLDDYIFSRWRPERDDLAQCIRDRAIADFRGAQHDPEKFRRGVKRLLMALRK